MMRNISKICVFLLLSALSTAAWRPACAQQKAGGVEFDRTVHDFGSIVSGSGAVSCTFNVRNTSDKPVVIYSVTTTCGCTDVEWTKAPLKPGESGKVKASYSNDEGPYPFDKTISVWLSSSSKPVNLRLRGVCRAKKMSLEEMYPLKKGPLGLEADTIEGGFVDQGRQRSGSFKIANLSSKAVSISTGKMPEGLAVKCSAAKIPAKGTAEITWTVTADRSRWGMNEYSFDILADGKKAAVMTVRVSTREDFSSLDKAAKEAGARPMFTSSTSTFNRVKAGTVIDVSYEMRNIGKETLTVYKVDCNRPGLSCPEIAELPAGGKTALRMKLDTSGMPSGEYLAIVTLTTNSPLRPVVNLFITGWIE